MIENTTKTVKSINKVNDLWKKYFTSKEISSDYDYPFNFKNANWYVTIVYLVSFIVLPIIYSLVKNYAYHVILINGKLPSPWNTLELSFTVLVPIIGIGLAFAVDGQTMIKRGAWAAYTHFIFGIGSAFFVSLFLVQTGVISGKITDPLTSAVKFLMQVIFQFIGALVVIFTNKALRKQIIATLKEAKLDLLIWILIFLFIITLLNLIFNTISDIVNNTNFFAKNDNSTSTSDNQKQLELMIKTPLGIFALILGSIFLAPINEEISYRYGTFSIVRHKWVAFAASLIYFPAMHIMDAGDWTKIFGYLGMGIMAPLLFICTRGNTTYAVVLHILLNTIATINLFATMK